MREDLQIPVNYCLNKYTFIFNNNLKFTIKIKKKMFHCFFFKSSMNNSDSYYLIKVIGINISKKYVNCNGNIKRLHIRYSLTEQPVLLSVDIYEKSYLKSNFQDNGFHQ